MDKAKIALIGAGVAVVIIGGLVYSKLDTWFSDEPQGPGSEDFYNKEEDEEPAGPGSGEELNVVGSCNYIISGSTCVDYVGSYWKTIEYAILNCSNDGVWSTSPCPRNYVGGCNTSSGTAQEMIMWFYNYGGDPFDQELTGYAAQSCNMNPYGTWIPG